MEVLDKNGLDYFWDKIKDYINSKISSGININVPVGSIIIWPGENIPTGWHTCDGSLINISEYQQLFDTIGHQYSMVTDNETILSTQFRLPNILGKTVIGKHSLNTDIFGQLGNSGGNRTHTISKEELPNFQYVEPTGTNTGHGTSNQGTPYTYTNDWASIGADQPMDIMNPYIVLNYIIKVKATEV